MSFLLVDHSSGFRIPVPSDWQVQKDVTVSGQSIPLITSGTTVDGFRTNVLVAYTSDSGAREDPSYLAALMNGTITELQREGHPAFLADGPTYLSVSGHLAVAFGVGYSGANYAQRAVIVVSAAHGREWVIVLSVALSAFGEANATFDSMVAGFQITAWPPFLVIGLIAGVAAAVVSVVVVFLVRYRRKHPRPAPTGAPSAAPPSIAVAFCGNCGAPVPPANVYATFCSSCGKPLQR
ncbi:MAG: zinc ribbon domain-containing protein [Methanobacteriota archaeon]|nr:MAG: zinc ribbon domain-containing protein [Euryarchaeota archaeon]